ncbi:heterogeneous nuclear ribonucleoprotein U-like protein 2 [Anopheles maculipalpis]|uniref:heterogeneous nuclear ribonucleoprotein U-like protein 2 n=1 Tax=Anopheles maculipalpis TaxID=1496333 RepID=UPI0021597DC3|nr:heterogeneous nuclear ribonucleoprotein U-like protein 2 [Anopheles maculipalpis]
MDFAKLKVADLKAELAARNLDTKGVKAVLLERLKEAIERETNASANVDLNSQQQYLAQQQHQQQLLLQQQLQAQQQLHAQQQLFIQQQQLQQQLQQQNAPVAEQQPQEQTIEDLSMSSKRVETPVRRRSTRRSMTRSPSPPNSSAENPHASLMGSARKRGRSRSMTKSPSPQRTTSEAPHLASVQEEEPEPAVEATDQQRLVTVEPTPEAAQPQKDDTSNQQIASDAEAPAAPSHQEPAEQAEVPEPTPAAAVPSAMEVEECEAVVPPVEVVEACNTDKEQVTLPVADTTESVAAEKLSSENDSKEDNKKVETEESPATVATSESDPKPATASAGETGANDKAKAAVTKAEKKQSAQQQAQNNVIEFVTEEVEPQLPTEAENTFTLSWYDSDLNLTIDDKDLLSAKPLSDGIFGLVWAGVRASHGVTGGKVFYEVLVTEELQPTTKSPLVPEGETPTPEMRIGWSTLLDSKRQLGETELSYGYSSCGKKVVGGTFEQYGVPFGKNDVVGVYLDMETTPCQMLFTVNRVRQGDAFEFDKESLSGKALFPHVYAKNLAFKVNFGTVAEGFPLTEKKSASTDKPATEAEDKDAKQSTESTVSKDPAADESAAKEETKADDAAKDETKASDAAKEETKADDAAKEETKADDAAKEEQDVIMEETESTTASKTDESAAERVPFDEEFKFLNSFVKQDGASVVEGLKGPASRDCCELVMMIGLPGSGKTTWVQNYLKENPESSFTLLSIDSLLENMKVLGKAREPSNTPQWQKVVEQLSRNMARLIEIACKRRRHILIDQTNVFASEQKRRLKGFGGFKTRRAVAVVPNLEEYKRRYELKVAKYGKEVPETTLNTMKANIFVPLSVQNWYTEIVYTELAETEAQELIKKMNEEGRKLLPPRRNRANQSNRQKHNNNNNANNSNYTSRWNHNRPQGGGQQYGKNRYGNNAGGSGGGYNRYGGNKSNDAVGQYGHHRSGDYRSGNGYGRRDDHHQHRGGNYGSGGNRYDSWNRNSGGGGGGYYNDRGYSNRGYNQQQQQQDHSNNRYDARRRDRRGYNNGSGWNAQGGQSQQWNNSYPKSGSSDSWYLWWQSNLNNLLAPNSGSADGSAASSSQWNQYGNSAHQSSSYGNYNSKG